MVPNYFCTRYFYCFTHSKPQLKFNKLINRKREIKTAWHERRHTLFLPGRINPHCKETKIWDYIVPHMEVNKTGQKPWLQSPQYIQLGLLWYRLTKWCCSQVSFSTHSDLQSKMQHKLITGEVNNKWRVQCSIIVMTPTTIVRFSEPIISFKLLLKLNMEFLLQCYNHYKCMLTRNQVLYCKGIFNQTRNFHHTKAHKPQ